MPDYPPVVPAAAGQEAILVTIVATGHRPTVDDVKIGRAPVVAWVPHALPGRSWEAMPVLPRAVIEGAQVLITMSADRVYSLRLGESFGSLDSAVAMLLREAQAQWDRDAVEAA